MHFSQILTTVLISVLFLISRVTAAPVPQNTTPPEPIPIRFANSTLFNSTITNSTGYPYGTHVPTNFTAPPGNWTGHYVNRTASGPALQWSNSTGSYPWMANRTRTPPTETSPDSSEATSGAPIKPTATITFQPFQGAAVSVGRSSGSWSILVVVVGMMVIL